MSDPTSADSAGRATSKFGLSKEQVLGCIGPPARKAAEGQTEVWSYNSGDGTTIASGRFRTEISPAFPRAALSDQCVISGGAVSAVNPGPTGGLITGGGQCAYAVDACVKSR
jgi:hypothetical protein